MKKRMGRIEEFLGAVILACMTILTVVNVFSRYILKASIAFTDELTTCFFVLLSLLGAAICTKRGSHLGLTLLTEHFSEKGKKCTAIFGCVCGAVFCAIVVYEGIFMVIHEYKMGQLTMGMNWPEWIFGSFVPVGGAFICMRFILSGIQIVKQKAGDKK